MSKSKKQFDPQTITGLVILVLIVVGTLIALSIRDPEEGEIKYVEEDGSSGAEVEVFLAGAVESEGVYRFDSPSTVADLLEVSGGLTDDANADFFFEEYPEERFLKNKEKIYVPEKGELSTISPDDAKSSNEAGSLGSAGVLGASHQSGKINLNTATAVEIEEADLYRIGEKRAKALVEYREKNGEFKVLEDVLEVDGIGPKTYERIKDQITLE